MRTDALERRRRIISVTCELMRSQSLDSLPLEEVARAANVGVATVYRNFVDKQELKMACAAEMARQSTLITHEAISDYPEAPEKVWRGYVDKLIELGVGTLLPALAPANFEDFPSSVEHQREQLEQALRDLIMLAHKYGQVRQDVSPAEFFASLAVIAHPPAPGLLALDPQVHTRLLNGYLEWIRRPSTAD